MEEKRIIIRKVFKEFIMISKDKKHPLNNWISDFKGKYENAFFYITERKSIRYIQKKG